MNKCPKCGQEVESKFCPDCGINVQEPLKCPKCGAVMKGRFCPDCGHDSQAKEKGKFIGKIKLIFNKCKDFFMANMKKCIVIGASALAAIILVIVLIVTLSNIFRVGKVSKIEIGMSKSKVIDILGDPTVDDENILYWYESKVAKKLDKAFEIENEFEFIEDEEDFEKFEKEYDKIYAEIEEMTYKFIMIKLDGDDKVTSVFLDKNHKYDDSDDYATEEKEVKKIELGMQNLSVISTTTDGVLEIKPISNPDKIKYIAKFEDGSYYLDTTYQSSMSITADESTATIKWDDRIAEYEVQKPVVIAEKYIIEKGITYNGDGTIAMSCEPQLKAIIFRDGATTVSEGFFTGLAFSEIYIPNSMSALNIENFDEFAIEKATVPVSYIKVLPKETLKTLIINEGATSIGGASGFTKLTSVTIPESATAISAEAFKDCSSLAEIIIPKNISSIGQYAFEGCKNLKKVYDFSNALEIKKDNNNGMVGYYSEQILLTFEDRQGDFLFITKNGVHYLNGYVGNGTVITLPDNYKNEKYQISNSAFVNSEITSVTIPDSVTRIGANAFLGCTLLTSVTIPSSVISIGENAFNGCTSLTSVTIPSSVISIGENAFNGCSSLKSLSIGTGITSLPGGLLSGCSSLESLTIPFVGDSIKSPTDEYQFPFGYIFGTAEYDGGVKTTQKYYSYNFMDRLDTSSADYYIPSSLKNLTIIYGRILYDAFVNCNSLTNVTIGKGVASIERYAFLGCNSLINVTFEEGSTCEIIEYGAFLNCLSLENIALPSSITSIEARAFEGCSSLVNVTFEDGSLCESFGYYAFADCSSLKHMTIPNSVISIGNAIFENCTLLEYNEYDNACYLGNDENPYLALVKAKNTDISSCTVNENTKIACSSAFYNCTSLESVNYFGAIEQWCNISFYSSLSNPLNNGAKLYLNGELVTELVIPKTTNKINDCTFTGCSSITTVTFEEGSVCEEIGYNAFSHCFSLKNITIPSSITSIEGGAFNSCRSLKDVNYLGTIEQWCNISFKVEFDNEGDIIYTVSNPLSNGANLHLNGELVTELTIPNTVKKLNNYAFRGCASITSVTIPDSITDLGSDAFRNCSSLTSVTIGNSVTSIGYSTFYGCSSLTSVTIGNSVTSTGYSAFYGCSSLTSITIPNSVTSIDSYAFSDCKSLTSITIPDSVTSIGDYAFSGCGSLTSVTIPDSVTSIGYHAFEHCTLSFTIYCEATSEPSGWDSYWNGNGIYQDSYYDLSRYPVVWNCNNNDLASNGYIYTVIDGIRYGIDYNTSDIKAKVVSPVQKNIEEAIIPESITYKGTSYPVTSIGERAFFNCSSLASITIPDSVILIGEYAFYNCKSLTSITIPDSVKWIEKRAFSGCQSLTSITIPDSVISIEEYAFENCTSLKIYCEATSEPSGWSPRWDVKGYKNNAALLYSVVWGYKGE